MNKTVEKAYAKINLTLDVIGKRKDGYHEMQMIMQQIDLFDEIIIKDSDSFQLTSSSGEIPLNNTNLVFKVYQQIKQLKNIEQPIHIHIDKHIPIAAGLAGGSADAAATYIALNRHFDLKLSIDEMMKLGVNLGADIPFCIYGKTALAKGIGEKLERLKNFSKHRIIIINPGYKVSTPSIFAELNLNQIIKRPNLDKALDAIEQDDIKALAPHMHNVLGEVTEKQHPDLKKIIKELENFGALKAMVSGSGPTVFGIFSDEVLAKKCYDKFKTKYPIAIFTKTL